jgi:TetR/AcrR family fatty acid metabolism transcriptional regulator
MTRKKNIFTEEGRNRIESKYNRILDAALEIFSSKGYHEAKIHDIASLAGIADGTVYLYFKNKEDMLVNLFHDRLSYMTQSLHKILESCPDSKSRLASIIEFHVKFTLENPVLVNFIAVELRRNSKVLKNMIKTELGSYFNEWHQVFEEGRQNGTFGAAFETNTIKTILYGALEHSCVNWIQNENRNPDELLAFGKELEHWMFSRLNAR